jgi:hypothetical protein
MIFKELFGVGHLIEEQNSDKHSSQLDRGAVQTGVLEATTPLIIIVQ